MLEEDEYTLVAEQRRGIRVDFVFALLYLADQLGVTTRAAVKVVKLGLDVLDKSTLGECSGSSGSVLAKGCWQVRGW